MSGTAKKINMPDSILEKEEYSLLAPLQKEEYMHNILKEMLRLNPIGLTISDIKKNTYFSHSVVWHHLEILASRGECLRIERSDTDVYHLNKIIDKLEEFDIFDDKSSSHFGFNFDLIENPFGNFLRIQRLRESRTEANTIHAGVIVPIYLIDGLIDRLKKIKETRFKHRNSTIL